MREKISLYNSTQRFSLEKKRFTTAYVLTHLVGINTLILE